VASRRRCDELIEAGSVRVNGRVIRELGVRVEPERDRIEVHGRPIPGPGRLFYYMVHKPVGVLTTLSDPEGRRTLRELLPPGPRLFPVGRLDADTSGLLLVTNDGELAHKLMHPRYGVPKVYRARVAGMVRDDQVRRLREGVEYDPGVRSAPAEVRVRGSNGETSVIEVVVREGRHRQVRRMCEAVGLAVRRLHRAAYGPLRLGELPRGESRPLTPFEVRKLKAESARPAGSGWRPAVPRRQRAPGAGSAMARSGRGETAPRRATGGGLRGRRAGFPSRARGGEVRPGPPQRFRPSLAESPQRGAPRRRFQTSRAESPQRGAPRRRFQTSRADGPQRGAPRRRFQTSRADGPERARNRPARPGSPPVESPRSPKRRRLPARARRSGSNASRPAPGIGQSARGPGPRSAARARNPKPRIGSGPSRPPDRGRRRPGRGA
jgi:23S rRNA pseudouridine2605 synthase